MKKILLITGESPDRDNTSEILALSNFRMLRAATPSDATVLAQKESPDILLCDVPDSRLYSTLAMIQDEPALCRLPLIVFTADNDKANTRRIMHLGADDYLVKPFDAIELLRAVDACLDRRQNRTTIPRPASVAQDSLPWRPADCQTLQVKKKKMLYSEGQRASQVWYIINGKVKTYLVHPDGKELITGIYGLGDCVGYLAALGGGAHTDNAQVLEDSHLATIPRQEFLSMLASDLALARQLVHWLSRSAHEKETGLLNFAYSSLRKKVANGILNLAASLPQEQEGKRYITISRENLAAFVGSAPESLTRTLSDFRKEGLIDVTDGHIWLLDEEKLKNMFN